MLRFSFTITVIFPQLKKKEKERERKEKETGDDESFRDQRGIKKHTTTAK